MRERERHRQREREIVDFAIMANYRVKLKENEKDKYLDLAKE